MKLQNWKPMPSLDLIHSFTHSTASYWILPRYKILCQGQKEMRCLTKSKDLLDRGIYMYMSRYLWRLPVSTVSMVYRCCCWVASVVSDSMRPHKQQPTRLPHPWDPLGKNTGVGCHFLLQCVKVNSESEVAQLCPTLSDPMGCSLASAKTDSSWSENTQWVYMKIILGYMTELTSKEGKSLNC